MAKLQPDYIKWVLTLNASQVREEFHKLEKDNKELEKRTNSNRKLLAELEAQGKRGSKEWNNLSKAINDNNREITRNKAKMAELKKQFDLGSMTVRELRTRLKELNKAFDNTSKATNPKRYEELRKELIKTEAALNKAKTEAKGLRGAFFSLSKMRDTLTGFFYQIGANMLNLVTGAFRSAFNIVVDFEKANARLASVLGTTTDGIKDLEAGARKLGATTSYSAAEVTGLQIELAKLGFDKQQILDMEAGVLKFAKAVDTDLGSAAAFAGAALRIFNKDAKDTENVLATFAIATTKTALDFSKLQTSLATVGPVANAFGLSIEDTTALLGQLANAGFDASSAATATRNIILNLCDANGDLAKALGAPVRNADDLAKGLKKLSDEGVDLAKALELTDKRSVSAFNVFLEHADDLVELRDSITGVKDEFNDMSDTMGNTVAGAMAGLRSAAEELVLSISSGTSGPIKDLINMLTSLVQWVGKVITFLGKFSGPIKAVTVAFVSYKLTVLAVNGVMKAYNTIVALSSNLMKGAKAAALMMSAGFKTLRGGIAGATTSWKAFGAALKATPWGAVLGAIASVVSAIVSLVSTTSEAEGKLKKEQEKMIEQMNAHREAREKFLTTLAAEKQKVIDLYNVANDMNIEEERRVKAIKELNKLAPEFNGYLEKEGKTLKGNKKELDNYIGSLEQKMRIMYYKDEYQSYLNEQMDAERRLRRAQEAYDAHKGQEVPIDGTLSKLGLSFVKNIYGSNLADLLESEINPFKQYEIELNQAKFIKMQKDAAIDALMKDMETDGINLEDIFKPAEGLTDDGAGDKDPLDDVIDKTRTLTEKIKELKNELKTLRKTEADNDEEYRYIEERKKRLKEQIKELEEKLGLEKKKSKKGHAAGTYNDDSIDEATAEADDLHQKKMLEINKLKGEMPEADRIIKKNKEIIRYCGDMLRALKKLRDNTDSTHTQTLDKIAQEENKIAGQMLAAQQTIFTTTAKKEQEAHRQRLASLQASYDEQEKVISREVDSQEKSQGAAELYLLGQRKGLHEAQLKELQEYYEKVQSADYLGAEEKRQILDKTNQDIRAMQSQVLDDTGKFAKKLREMMTDTTSAAGIKDMFDRHRQDIEKEYAIAIKAAGEGTEEAVALEREKQRRIAALNYQYQEQVFQLQELTGLSWAQEYDRELLRLENMHTQGLISEKNYQKARLMLQTDNAKKYFDYYSQLSGSMFSAIQEAEIAQSDAKYDVLIQQAKNNGEDTAALEEEKENKKLEIQKKYADVNFAIKVSQIIADTAVSIMKAFADLGPIGGAVAAAMLTATGAAQLVSAKAERDKIKNMQPSKTAGSAAAATPAKAERVLTGYAEGGYTGDGDRYEVAGVVHRGEYVVPKPIMSNPRVVDAVGTIEAIRRNKGLPSAVTAPFSTGYADGGHVAVPAPSLNMEEFTKAVQEFKAATRAIRAYIVYRDIEDAKETMNRARAPFTRNQK